MEWRLRCVPVGSVTAWTVTAVEVWRGEVSYGMARRGGLRRLRSVVVRHGAAGSVSAVLVRCGEARRGRSGLGKARRLRWDQVWSDKAW